jgi:hypothetical protein
MPTQAQATPPAALCLNHSTPASEPPKTLANSQSTANLAMGSTGGIPRLSLGAAMNENRAEYHKEFMDKQDEFSESWRKALELEKKF